MSVPTPSSGPDADPLPLAGIVPPVNPPSRSAFDAGGVVRRRRRKRRRKPPYLAIAAGVMALALVCVGVGMGVVYLVNLRSGSGGANLMSGYIADASTVDREYQRYYGKPADNNMPVLQFRRGAELVRSRRYAEAADLLELLSQQAALPVVFNDLGVIYADLNDWPRATNAFREALVRDSRYPAVLANLKRMKGLTEDVGTPLSHEVEPNNNRYTANLIAVGTPVEGEITPGAGDVDFFRFSLPPAPRDVVAVELVNHDRKFAPRLDIYDGEFRVLDWGRKTVQAGESLTVYGSSAPNASIYVEVSAADNSSGRYGLTIKPMKAYDPYEPNDDIFHAHAIGPVASADGLLEYAPIKANIMDRDDTDFYSFVAPRTGKATVEVHNESVTLIPAVQFYGPAMRSIGFGPSLKNPGESLETTLDVEKGQTYYIQVWSQADTSGPYTLAVH